MTEAALARQVFVFSAAKDAPFLDRLTVHLKPLVRQGRITLWPDPDDLGARADEEERRRRLEASQLCLILVSPDLLGSDDCDCWGDEVRRAIERHRTNEARLVPIFLCPAARMGTPLEDIAGGLPDPTGARPISKWPDQNDGFLAVFKGLARLLDDLDGLPAPPPSLGSHRPPAGFDRALYLRSFIERMRRQDDEQSFDARTFVELEKHVFHPVRDTDDTSPERLRGRAPQVRHTRRRLLALVLDPKAGKVTALLGDPGSGKSVALRRLAVDLAEEAKQSEGAPLPVLLSLGTYTTRRNGRTALAEFLRASIARGPSAERDLAPLLGERMKRGEVILLLDGMDEMPRGDFGERVDDLLDLARDETLCPMVIACRRADFPASQLAVRQIRLSSFGAADAITLIQAHQRKDRREATAIASELFAPGAPLAGLVQNPFYLTLALRFLDEHGSLPASRADLFQGLLEQRLEKARARDPAARSLDLEGGIAGLALAMFASGGAGTALPIGEIATRLTAPPVPLPALIDAGQAAGILERDASTGAVRFIHARIQEFLVAHAIGAQDPAERQRWLGDHFDDPWLSEVFVLLAQHSDVSTLVGRIADEAEAEILRPPAAPPSAVLRHEMRLILAGSLVEAAALGVEDPAVAHLAWVLSALAEQASRQPLPMLRRRRVLLAARGALVDEPRVRRWIDAALRDGSDLEEEAALAALVARPGRADDVQRELTAHVRWQAVRRDFVFEWRRYQRIAASTSRLGALRPLALRGLGLHILLIAVATAIQLLVVHAGAPTEPVGAVFGAFALIVIFYWVRWLSRGSRPHSALSIHLTMLAVGAEAFAIWMLTHLTADLGGGLLDLPRFESTTTSAARYARDAVLIPAVGVTLVLPFAGAAPAQALVRSARRAATTGLLAGVAVVLAEANVAAAAWPRWTVIACGLLTLACLARSIAVIGWRRVLLPAVVTLLFVIFRFMSASWGGATVHTLWSLATTAFSISVAGFLVFGSVAMAVDAVRSNVAAGKIAKLRPESPLTLEQAEPLLDLLSSAFVLSGRWHSVVRRLGSVNPPSEVLALALREVSTEITGARQETISLAVEDLENRIRRVVAPAVATRLRRELPVLEMIRRALPERIWPAVTQRWATEKIERGELAALAGEEQWKASGEALLQAIEGTAKLEPPDRQEEPK